MNGRGPLLFARYAYPPNALGHCGPADGAALREYGRSGGAEADLGRLARSFTGAWPYLELIADRAGIRDPLDHRVVEAYWVGNGLLAAAGLAGAAGPRRPGLGLLVGGLTGDVLDAAVAHHSFHVLCAYPWAGMLPDPRRAGQALDVLDRCRVRWGRVTAAGGGRVVVRTRPLAWDGRRLGLGRPVERAYPASFVRPAAGDWVSLHWDWVCDRLSERQVRALRRYTRRHLDVANTVVGRLAGAAPAGG